MSPLSLVLRPESLVACLGSLVARLGSLVARLGSLVARLGYQNADVDRMIEEASSATNDQQRRMLYGRAQQIIAHVPYICLWYKTNIAVFQPDIHGVRLSPIADFMFLKDVYRSAPGTAAH
jgi:ABC-type transport system substrate-binding protein